MSGADIAREVAAALREVAGEVGDGEFLVTLKTPTGGSATPWGGVAPSVTEQEIPAMVSSYPASMIDGTLIRATDKRVMIAAENGGVPTTAATLEISGVNHEIVSVDTLSPSGVALYYIVQARA